MGNVTSSKIVAFTTVTHGFECGRPFSAYDALDRVAFHGNEAIAQSGGNQRETTGNEGLVHSGGIGFERRGKNRSRWAMSMAYVPLQTFDRSERRSI